MNKATIRKFAEWARERLIADITYKAGTLGITEKGIAEKLPQSTGDMQFFDIGTKNYAEVSGREIAQRETLVKVIQTREKSFQSYKEAFDNIVEEVAYTWFNRLIAIRFMEINEYLPSGIRVLSSENSAKVEPDFVTTPFDTDLEFTSYEKDLIIQLKDENELDDLFRMLFIKQCNKLNEILPELFEKTDDFSELLLNISFTDREGIIYRLTHDIDEADFDIREESNTNGQVEIIGWLYQYYISKKHDEIINIYKGTIKKADIPAATQLFTTDWVVRYMVDNSLGRYWIERNPESKLADKLEFFVTPKDGTITYIDDKVYPTDLTFFDPCMGSGHILVYAFDVLMEIYRECGYSDRDAALNIVQNNLFGLDIDKRAYQLAYFAVMMKARSYNRRALTQGIYNNLAFVEESNAVSEFTYEPLTKDKEQNKIGEYLVEAFKHVGEIGSLQTIEEKDYKSFAEYLLNIEAPNAQMDMFSTEWLNNTKPLMLQFTKQAIILSNKYAVVCTNPPYMNKLEGHLKDFVVNNYKAYSGDLFSVFMYRNFGFCKEDGYSAFMTPYVWMFLKTYEALRKFIINSKAITSIIQMEYSAFEEATVPICSFVLENRKNKNKSLCFRLSDFKGGMEVQKKKVLEAIDDKNCGYFYESQQDDLLRISGCPIAYWANESTLKAFEEKSVGYYGEPKQGFATGNNDRFLRFWMEVAINKIGFGYKNRESASNSNKKWFPCNKGGGFRRWYGNNNYVANWENDGMEMTAFSGSVIRNPQYYFRKGITWSSLTSGKLSMRFSPEGFIFESKGSVCFIKNEDNLFYMLGLLNTEVVAKMLLILSPTLDYHEGPMSKVPVIMNENVKSKVDKLVLENVDIVKADWDSYETSWDFKAHPLVAMKLFRIDSLKKMKLASIYIAWKTLCEERFYKLKMNEEELNSIFIDIYSLQGELVSEVEEKDVSVSKADLQRDIKGLLSYAVGCMFGRYSLDNEGIAYAGGDWDSSKYDTFIPDADNCIPITDEEYFEDDIVGLLCAWLKKVYGEDTLEENLDFIANALGNKGNTSREIIRNYFLNDFIKDHIKIYQKRPIYWLFDSGKQNGFKALCYMHRWNEDTIGNMRVEYLHRMQRVYDKEIERMQEIIDNSHDNKEISVATKRKEKLQKQIKEAKEYDVKVAHLALARIGIDLDDGVKVNYEKVQTAPDGKKMQILVKI